MTVFVTRPYDERLHHLALGIDPRSALSGARVDAGVEVRWERYPSPVRRWRTWHAGETLTDVLPRLARHHSGRFVRRYGDGVARPMVVRLVDRRLHYVPRRLEIPIPTEAAVVSAVGQDLTPVPAWRRTFAVGLFPGAAAPLTPGSTVVRGRVVRQDGGVLRSVRWARVRATVASGAVDVEVGWAHGDDRGEFVLVLRPPSDALTVPADPMVVNLTVSRQDPPPLPPATDPDLADLDLLWDLPLERVVPSPTAATGALLTGRGFVPGFPQVTPVNPVNPISLRHGRHTSVVLRIA